MTDDRMSDARDAGNGGAPAPGTDDVADAVLKYYAEHPALLGGIEPPERDLWAGITQRIEAPVLRLPVAPGVRPARGRGAIRWLTIAPLVAAAVLLAVLSSGITYVLTRRGAAVEGMAPSTRAASTGATSDVGRGGGPAGGLSNTPTEAAAPTDPRSPSPAPRSRLAGHQITSDAASAVAPGERVYDAEIGELRELVDRRRDRLDSATVATIEQNLRVIDDAIRQARAALARDPASRFLGEQLDRVLSRKVELLRTAALLPSSA